MALQQVYWNQRQAAGSWTVGLRPGLLHPENEQLPTSRLFINHSRTSGVVLWSYHANLVRGSTSPIARDVELEEKDTEGGEKTQSSVGRYNR